MTATEDERKESLSRYSVKDATSVDAKGRQLAVPGAEREKRRAQRPSTLFSS